MNKKMDEFKLIEWIKQFNKSSIIGDDTAVLEFNKGKKLLVTADMLVENTHFLKDNISPYQLGYKTLAVNLSDIAAMGGRPRYIILSCCWSVDYTDEDIKKFFEGLYELSSKYQVELAGGDTCRGDNIALDLCVLGDVKAGAEVTRSGAKEGDYLVLSGPLGGSAAGLQLVMGKKINCLTRTEREELLQAHLMPQPKVIEGYELGERGLVNAMIDVSDGLSSEVHHLAKNSQVGALIYEKEIPILESVKKAARELDEDPVNWALKGGEDYQLLMCVNEKNVNEVITLIKNLQSNYDSTYDSFFKSPKIVGKISDKSMGVKIEKDGTYYELKRDGYKHF